MANIKALWFEFSNHSIR